MRNSAKTGDGFAHKCERVHSENGIGPAVKCNGRYDAIGRYSGGCDEPCRFRMAKAGEGKPPLPDNYMPLTS